MFLLISFLVVWAFLKFYYFKNAVVGAPDFIPISYYAFFRHFVMIGLVDDKEKEDLVVVSKGGDEKAIIGYSCRSVFRSMVMVLLKENPDLKVAATPLHHTSYRNILQELIPKENLQLLPVDKKYQVVTAKPVGKVDLVVVTHLFGRDLDLSVLDSAHKDYLYVEDRCQGGTLNKTFSTDKVDISLYSYGMDKRPVALGGGMGHFRVANKKEVSDVFDKLEAFMRNLDQETPRQRLFELVLKIPTLLLYNFKPFTRFFLLCVDGLQKVGVMRLRDVVSGYRKRNPGFEHDKFMKRPSAALVHAVRENMKEYQRIEDLYTSNFKYFIDQLASKGIADIYMPWNIMADGSSVPLGMHVYNTIWLDEKFHAAFLDFTDRIDVRLTAAPNPTYKILGDPEDHIKKLNGGLFYITTLQSLPKDEIDVLAGHLAKFAGMHKLEPLF